MNGLWSAMDGARLCCELLWWNMLMGATCGARIVSVSNLLLSYGSMILIIVTIILLALWWYPESTDSD